MNVHDMYQEVWNQHWLWVVIFILLALAVISMIYFSWKNRKQRRFYTRKKALKDLEHRYQEGEISEIDYQDRKKEIILEKE